MVETFEVQDSRTGETVECLLVNDAAKVAGVTRRTLERHASKGTIRRYYLLDRTLHPVSDIRELIKARSEDGDRPGGAPPPPKPRPETGPPRVVSA